MNITPDSLIAFAVVVVALALGFVWDMRHAPIKDDPDPRDLPCIDAAAAVLAAELWPEIEAHLGRRA